MLVALSVAVVIMNVENKVLAVERRDDPSKLCLPGGKVEPQDTQLSLLIEPPKRVFGLGVAERVVSKGIMNAAHHAALRETKEETGFDLDFREDLYNLPIHTGLCVDETGSDPETICLTFLHKNKMSMTDDPEPQPGEPPSRWVEWHELFSGPFGYSNMLVWRQLHVEHPDLMKNDKDQNHA